MNLSTQLDIAVTSLPDGELTADNIHGDQFAPILDFGLSGFGPVPKIPGYRQSVEDWEACSRKPGRLVPFDAARVALIDDFFSVWSSDFTLAAHDFPLSVLMPMAPDTWRKLHLELMEAELLWLASATEPFPHPNLLAALDATL